MANVLLQGAKGAGKSCLISTLDGLMRGQLTRRAEYGICKDGFTITEHLRKYSFSEGTGPSPLLWIPLYYAQVHTASQHLRS